MNLVFRHRHSPPATRSIYCCLVALLCMAVALGGSLSCLAKSYSPCLSWLGQLQQLALPAEELPVEENTDSVPAPGELAEENELASLDRETPRKRKPKPLAQYAPITSAGLRTAFASQRTALSFANQEHRNGCGATLRC